MDIRDIHFGRISIQGEVYTKDLKICGDQVLCPWWRKKGHQVDVEDVQDLIRAGPEILVIGKGSPGLMQATDRLKNVLQEQGVDLVEAPTPEAVAEYLRLRGQGKKVDLGVHLFC
mgnify:CR=1 FL=1